MVVPKFTVASFYRAEAGDYLLLPFHDDRQAAYTPSFLPKGIGTFDLPKEKGKGRVIYVNSSPQERIFVRVQRLDAEHSTEEAELAKATAQTFKEAKEQGCQRIVVLVEEKKGMLLQAVQEGALLGGYVFDKYLEKKEKPLPVHAVVTGAMTSELKQRLREGEILYTYVNHARDLMNEPPNVIHPPSLATAFAALGKKCGLKVEVWDEKRLKNERCGGILAVGQGAAAKPRLVLAQYAPKGAKRHLALIGKGLTFDTGGYCLKPADGQAGMKYDMAGAAMMFCAGCAIAALKIPLRLTVLAPLAQNDISSTAYHPSDILITRSGKTVQVDNTDAEGRLLLADALAIAAEKNPDLIIDAATLTGACVIALGEDIAGAYGTAADSLRRWIEVGRANHEFFWELPLHMPYREKLKATIADCKNIGDKTGGSITGALFLKQFVPDSQPWIHLDIAGPAGKEEPLGPLGKGAKGFGVKTAVAFARIFAHD